MSMTLTQVRDDLLSKLGIEDVLDATDLMKQDCVVAINAAMQQLQTAGHDFFTRQTVSVTLSAGTATYSLPGSVQAVIGPIKLDGTPMTALNSDGELDQYDRIFGDATAFGTTAGTPRAYWVDNTRSGTTGDINLSTVSVAPSPQAAGTLQVDVINDAPSYGVSDLATSTVLPIAQNYTESVFLPIARMLVSRSSNFSRPDLIPQITSDYQAAMQRLGMAGGFPPTVAPIPPREIQA
jgi:hypothetical protein